MNLESCAESQDSRADPKEGGGAGGVDAIAGAAALEEAVLFDHGEAEGGEDQFFAGSGTEDDIAFFEDAVAAEGGGDAAHGFVGDGDDAGADGDFAAEFGAGLVEDVAEGGEEAFLLAQYYRYW